jgi:putative membrane protein
MNRILLILKWLLMWACDVIPWVSGGTIAFITGIYDELIDALHWFNIDTIKLLLKGKIKAVWKNIHGNFLLSVFGWIFVAILTLSKLISYLLETYPVLIRAFFFGLIVASAIILRKSIKKYKLRYLLLLLIWTAIWFIVTGLPVLNLWSGNLTMFVSWAIAIIAMILPGISGSYILVILWQYQEVLWNIVSLTGWDIKSLLPIVIFMWWAVVWLLSFAKLLHWIKSRRHDQMIVVLIWFMIWSLNKVRPWKETVETFVDRHGEIQPLVQNNIMPVFSMEVVTAISIAIWWFVVVLWLEFLAKKLKK